MKRPLQIPFDVDPKPFLQHFDDLRRTIVRCLVAWALGVLICFPLAPWIKRVLVWPFLHSGVFRPDLLRSLDVGGALGIAMQLALWCGLLIALPFVLHSLAVFILPGVKPAERRWVSRVMISVGALFFVGVIFSYFLVMPVALRVMMAFHAWMGIGAEWTIQSYLGFILQVLLGFGLAFELPVGLVLLGLLGLVSVAALREKRRHVIVGILVLATIMTPPDVTTMLLMAAPLIILYECCILLLALFQSRDRERKAADDTDTGVGI